MKVIIGEDEVLVAEHLSSIVEQLGYTVVGVEHSKEDILNLVQLKEPDIVLLDIRMDSSETGFEVASELIKLNIPYVFISAHSDDVSLEKAFDLNPLGYIVKPFSLLQIKATLKQAESTLYDAIIELKVGREERVRVLVSEICYVRADNVYCELFLDEKRVVIRSSLKALLNLIGENFLERIGRSYAINPKKVIKETKVEFLMEKYTVPKPKNYSV